MIHIHTLKVRWLYSLVLFLASTFSFAQSNELSFLFVGDVMQHDGQITAARNKTSSSYEYEDGFKFIKPIINQYDIRIANLEVTLAGEPYKGYPQFSAPDELAETLVSSGFNVILTANNHSCDRGTSGVVRTLDVLDELGVKHTGTFRSKEEREKNYPLVIEENGLRVALLNYTYGTNGLFVKEPVLVNYIDSAVIKKDVEKAKAMKVDYIICNMHWGTEYKLLPNNYQKRFESYCYDLGVDMVIGGHPHVLQPVEQKMVRGEEKLTVWSLGNFVSNMQVRYTRGGAMVGAEIEKTEGKTKLKSSEHWLVYVLARQEGAVKQYYILPEFDYNKYRPDFMTTTDLTRMNEFMTDSRNLYREHNSGCPERKVEPGSNTEKLFIHFLTGYYSVWLPEIGDEILLDEKMKPFVHEHLDHSGKSFILSGVFRTLEQAEGNLQFIKDCQLVPQPKIVSVKPEEVKPVQK